MNKHRPTLLGTDKSVLTAEMAQYRTNYRAKNVELILTRDKEYRDTHFNERRAYDEKNKEKISEQQKAYKLAHRDKVNENKRKSYHKRKAELAQENTV